MEEESQLLPSMNASIIRRPSTRFWENTRKCSARNVTPTATLKKRWHSRNARTAIAQARMERSSASAPTQASVLPVTTCKGSSLRPTDLKNTPPLRTRWRASTPQCNVRNVTFPRARTLYSRSSFSAALIVTVTSTLDSLPPLHISTAASAATICRDTNLRRSGWRDTRKHDFF